MVGAPAAADAVARARRLPGLHVGLHLVLVDGRPVSPPAAVNGLVDRAGEFDRNLARAGLRFFCLPAVRKQLAIEIRPPGSTSPRPGWRSIMSTPTSTCICICIRRSPASF